MTYVRNQKRRSDLEIIELIEGRVECLAVEVRLCNEKWIILSVYKEPKTKNDVFNVILKISLSNVSLNNVM